LITINELAFTLPKVIASQVFDVRFIIFLCHGIAKLENEDNDDE